MLGLALQGVKAQVSNEVVVERDIKIELSHIFYPRDVKDNWVQPVKQEAMPEPVGLPNKLTQKLDDRRMKRMQQGLVRHGNFTGTPADKAAIAAKVDRGFYNYSGGGTPNDNHVAVGNDGKFIAVLNTVIRVYDTSGKFIKVWGLENYTSNSSGNNNVDTFPTLTRTYDPRVIYCPDEDRYMVLYMHGTTETTSFIVVGYSSSNNPLDPWYVYKIPGRPTKDSVWSDYPIVSHNKEDFFFTVNLLLNGTSWEEGFTEAVIWQLNKDDGFNGRTLGTNLFRNIKYKGVSIWSIGAIQNGPMPHGTDNYFMSVRPYAEINDTVFLHRITNTQRSGKAEYELKVLKSDIPYGNPPSALQPDTAYKLRTNDARVLGGIRVGKQIQYVQNCMNFKTMQAHFTHSTIHDIQGETYIKGKLITNDSLEFGYPAIASAGVNDADPSSIITMVHTGPKHFPGTSVMYSNRYGEVSNNTIVKDGESLIYISFLPKNFQRWGDYEGIQRKFNEEGVYYLIGSYGRNNGMFSWVARVKINDGVLSQPVGEVRVFPIPSQTHVDVELINCNEGEYSFELYNMIGQPAMEVQKYMANGGTNLYRINTLYLSDGTYVLIVKNKNGKQVHKQKIMAN